MASLQPLTAFGKREPVSVTHGPLTITERTDIALASVAVRKGRAADLAKAAEKAGAPLPGPSLHQQGSPCSAFWTTPEMWFVEAPFASHELIADLLKSALGDAASITEQTDAWVAFDLAAPDLAPLLERLCNVDYPSKPEGYATRTVMEHLGVYLIKHGPGAARIYGPRSSAESLLHAIETAAHSVW
ncbi:sarcosine oxidase subunit gamma [Rhodobacter calidifons]|uniref:Sarcosine oxidase subunit gamma n=1 Tax=Rhodobacter calidifons TaxID=2715277 RepID=A0ABX0GB52_9RHOB|nr:sarcosine oxidase subunit gamma [Rhodobacter calidifons]NHB78072.1 sarcosine oxidase subunit gamma [Rhodobacter calidifons]